MSDVVDRQLVLERVQSLLEPVKGAMQLAVFPDSALEFQTKYLKSKAGAILISYAGSRKLPSGGSSLARQMAVDVVVLSRKRSGDYGALAAVAAVEAAVDGKRFTLSGFGWEVAFLRDRFLGEEEETYQYACSLTCTTL